MANGKVYSIAISPERGQLKKEVPEANLMENHGIEHDGHAGEWGRQVTCLSWESVQKTNMEYRLSASPGDFAENLLFEGLDLSAIEVGQRFRIAGEAVLEVTQIGKEDHPSVVTKTFGVSLLPSEGLFCKTIKGGRIKKGDVIEKL